MSFNFIVFISSLFFFFLECLKIWSSNSIICSQLSVYSTIYSICVLYFNYSIFIVDTYYFYFILFIEFVPVSYCLYLIYFSMFIKVMLNSWSVFSNICASDETCNSVFYFSFEIALILKWLATPRGYGCSVWDCLRLVLSLYPPCQLKWEVAGSGL